MTRIRIETPAGRVWGHATQDVHGSWNLVKCEGFYVPGETNVRTAQCVRIEKGYLESYLSLFHNLNILMEER